MISTTITALTQELIKGSERGVFWDEQRKTNVDPLQGVEGGFWGATWDLKVLISSHPPSFAALNSCLAPIAQDTTSAGGAAALP